MTEADLIACLSDAERAALARIREVYPLMTTRGAIALVHTARHISVVPPEAVRSPLYRWRRLPELRRHLLKLTLHYNGAGGETCALCPECIHTGYTRDWASRA